MVNNKAKLKVTHHYSKLTKSLRTKSFKQSRFSRANLTIFGIVFAAIGGYIIYSSFAATPTVANVWVDTNGGSCTYSSTPVAYSDAAACGTFDAAWDKAAAGNTIVVKNGNYSRQDINGDKASDTYITGESKAGVVISGTDQTCIDPGTRPDSVMCAGGDHLFLRDVTVDTNTLYGTEAIGSFITGTNITYKNVDLLGEHPDMTVSGSGFTWDGGTYADPGPHEKLCGRSYGETVWVQNGADDVRINGIQFNPQTTDLSCQPLNPHVEAFRIESGSNNITLSNNTYMPGWEAGSGYIFYSVTDTTNFRVIGNYFADNDASTWAQVPGSNPIDLVAYNTFSGDDGMSGGATTWVGNLGPNPQGVCSGTHIKNVWGGSGSCGSDTFVGSTSLGIDANGHLQAGSPAINAAETPGASDYCTDASTVASIDFDGGARPQGSACDAGADEFGATGGGGPVANLWVDATNASLGTTAGGSCTRSATTVVYNDTAACSSLNVAYQQAQPGDIILWRGGSYGSQNIANRTIGTTPVIVHPAPGETVNVTGEISLGTHDFVIDGGDQVDVNETNRIIVNRPSLTTDTATFEFVGTGTGKVIEDVKGDSFWFGDASNATFRYSELGPLDACSGTIGIQHDGVVDMMSNNTLSTNITVQGNYFHDLMYQACPGDDEHADMMDISFANSNIIGNRFLNCGTQCIFNTPNTGTPALSLNVENNMFEGVGSIGVQSDGDWTLRYNTMGVSYRAGPFNQSNLTATGNLWTTSVSCNATNPSNAPGSTVTQSYSVFPTSQGAACGTGSTLANVSFINSPTQADFHVASGSYTAVQGKGNPTYCPATDFDNQTRPQPSATTCDAGADEVGGSLTPPPPTPPPPAPPPPTPPTPPAPPGTQLLGNQTIETTADGLNAQQAQAWPFTASASGTADSAALYLDATSSAAGVLVGLYSDSSGSPGALLGTATISVPVSGWNSANFASSINITAGTQYWIGVLGTGSGSLVVRSHQNGTCTSKVNAAPNNWTSLHNPFGTTGGNFTSCPLSAYILAASSGGTKVGDLNADGSVNIFDLSIMLSKYNTNNAGADLNSDGTVNIFDLSILLSHYGS
jgi:hypothetical protein